MYYAYSISLMYFLRAKNDSNVNKAIFEKLMLTEEQIALLNCLMLKSPTTAFTSADIRLIETILGRATRNLAGERTRQEFLAKPYDSSTFAATVYGIEFHIKQALKARNNVLKNLIDNNFKDPLFTSAEIYRVPDIIPEMKRFSNKRLQHIISQFNGNCAQKARELGKGLSAKEKKILLDAIIREETLFFFSENKAFRLNIYVQHLQKEYVWGSEETLMNLHRAIQGEHLCANAQGEFLKDIDIPFTLQVGRSLYSQIHDPVMILNNQDNMHWTSIIPRSTFSLPPTEPCLAPKWITEPSKALSTKMHDSFSTTGISTSIRAQGQEPILLEKDSFCNIIVQDEKIICTLLSEMQIARDKIPKSKKQYKLADDLVKMLEVECPNIFHGKTIEYQEEAVNRLLTYISNSSLRNYQDWNSLFKNFLLSLSKIIPNCLGGNAIRSTCFRIGIFEYGNHSKISRTIERICNTILERRTALDSIDDKQHSDEKVTL